MLFPCTGRRRSAADIAAAELPVASSKVVSRLASQAVDHALRSPDTAVTGGSVLFGVVEAMHRQKGSKHAAGKEQGEATSAVPSMRTAAANAAPEKAAAGGVAGTERRPSSSSATRKRSDGSSRGSNVLVQPAEALRLSAQVLNAPLIRVPSEVTLQPVPRQALPAPPLQPALAPVAEVRGRSPPAAERAAAPARRSDSSGVVIRPAGAASGDSADMRRRLQPVIDLYLEAQGDVTTQLYGLVAAGQKRQPRSSSSGGASPRRSAPAEPAMADDTAADRYAAKAAAVETSRPEARKAKGLFAKSTVSSRQRERSGRAAAGRLRQPVGVEWKEPEETAVATPAPASSPARSPGATSMAETRHHVRMLCITGAGDTCALLGCTVIAAMLSDLVMCSDCPVYSCNNCHFVLHALQELLSSPGPILRTPARPGAQPAAPHLACEAAYFDFDSKAGGLLPRTRGYEEADTRAWLAKMR